MRKFNVIYFMHGQSFDITIEAERYVIKDGALVFYNVNPREAVESPTFIVAAYSATTWHIFGEVEKEAVCSNTP